MGWEPTYSYSLKRAWRGVSESSKNIKQEIASKSKNFPVLTVIIIMYGPKSLSSLRNNVTIVSYSFRAYMSNAFLSINYQYRVWSLLKIKNEDNSLIYASVLFSISAN